MPNAHKWQPGCPYGQGDVVEYNGRFYNIIQPHRSQADWTPDVTPALWGAIPSDSVGDYSVQHQQQTQGQIQLGQGYNPSNDYQQPGGLGKKLDGGDASDDDDDAKQQAQQGWLTDKRKHQMMIGGGILTAGAAIGAGVFAYSKFKDAKEEKAKKEAWAETMQGGYGGSGEEVWERGARARTGEVQNGRGARVNWVYVDGNEVPQNAIYGGREPSGETLYIARSFYEGGLHPGKAASHLQSGSSISYGGSEIPVSKHEVLVGDENAVEWITLDGRVEKAIEKTGKTPVEGGREKDGTFLFVARAKHEGGIFPAKAHEDNNVANFGFGGEEISAKEYQILFYRE